MKKRQDIRALREYFSLIISPLLGQTRDLSATTLDVVDVGFAAEKLEIALVKDGIFINGFSSYIAQKLLGLKPAVKVEVENLPQTPIFVAEKDNVKISYRHDEVAKLGAFTTREELEGFLDKLFDPEELARLNKERAKMGEMAGKPLKPPSFKREDVVIMPYTAGGYRITLVPKGNYNMGKAKYIVNRHHEALLQPELNGGKAGLNRSEHALASAGISNDPAEPAPKVSLAIR